MKMPGIVCFLADKHGLYDDRIYWKMALSLIKVGYQVHYIFIGTSTAKGITKEGVYYESFKQKKYSSNRYINYLVKYSRKHTNYDHMFEAAAALKADVYHFHDLNINKIGVRLKRLAHRPIVIYDVRDPYAQNIKDYIGSKSVLKPLIHWYAAYINTWEKRQAKHYDLIITNEDNLQGLFQKVTDPAKVIVIYNYTYFHTLRKELTKEYDLIYCGGITEFRGAHQIIEAVKLLQAEFKEIKLLFLGNFFTPEFKAQLAKKIDDLGLTNHVILKDSVPYNEVVNYYNRAKIGLGIFLPIPTHELILQIKIFEYMAMGLPMIGSNFGHINDYILKDQVGLVVDPTNPQEIAEATSVLLNDHERYHEFRNNGIRAATQKYHWGLMEDILITKYDQLLKQRASTYAND